MSGLVVHAEPRDWQWIRQGSLVDPAEIDAVVLAGGWDAALESEINWWVDQSKSAFAYFQSFTKPDRSWQDPLPKPLDIMRQQPAIPLVKAWAHGRDAVDWSVIHLGELGLVPPPRARVFVDNHFPHLQPWMFGASSWVDLPSLGLRKRQAYARQVQAFVNSVAVGSAGGPIVNGQADDQGSWVMMERAGARKLEVSSVVRSGFPVLISVPSHEYWNWDWAIQLWLSQKWTTMLSFTSDYATGVQDGYSQMAYSAAVEARRG